MSPRPSFLLSIVFVLSSPVNGDEELFLGEDLEDRIARVNEGQLYILPQPPARPVHHHRNEITITHRSLADGWVHLHQCHTHLDRVEATQILFNQEHTRGLELLSVDNIGSSWVAGASIQLRGIQSNAKVCIQAETHALKRLSAQRFRLSNGPFKRQFLDGYYPMRVTLDIRYPEQSLKLHRYDPKLQPGLNISQDRDGIRLDVWFEGKLMTQFDFHRL